MRCLAILMKTSLFRSATKKKKSLLAPVFLQCLRSLPLTLKNMQAMMKDPFGNYVVQKVLETCDDQSLSLIISRIKVHLNALKRYTYGKHIVARVEKLITTGGNYLFSLCITSSKTNVTDHASCIIIRFLMQREESGSRHL